MIKLVYAQLRRLKRSGLFWLALVGIAAISAYRCADNVQNADYFEWMLFEMSPYFSFLYAGFIGLFVGTEYSDGAMRNKLAVGHTRAAVYGANLFVSTLVSILFQVVMFAIIWAVGPLTMQTQLPAFTFAYYMLCGLLVCMAFAAVFTAVAMLCSNKAGATVLAFVVAFGLFFVSAQINDRLSEPETIQNGPIVFTEDGKIMIDPSEVYDNPLYIPEGPVRDALGTINSVLPSGQAVDLGLLYSKWRETTTTPADHWYWPLCSILFTVVVSAAGLAVYKRKDIK